MGSLEDALKKAGLAAPVDEPEAGAAPKESAAEGGEKSEAAGGEKRPPREPRAKTPAAPSEPLVEKPCAKCSTPFMPKHSKHRLCPKCAEEQFNASKEKSDKPKVPKENGTGQASGLTTGLTPGLSTGPNAGSSTGSTSGGPRPERRDRPARPPRSDRGEARPDRPQGERKGGGERPQGERPHGEHREPRPQQQREPQRNLRNEPKEAPQGFPKDYLQSGYFVGAVIRDDVFDTWARHVAGLLVSRGLSTNQMRAFLGHVQRAEASAKAGRDFKEVREELMKMRPVAAARLGRKLIPGEFADFLDRNLDQVNDARALRAFAEHFQAVVGYTAGRLKK